MYSIEHSLQYIAPVTCMLNIIHIYKTHQATYPVRNGPPTGTRNNPWPITFPLRKDCLVRRPPDAR